MNKSAVREEEKREGYFKKALKLPSQQVSLSKQELKLKKMYGKLPLSFSKDWDARIEPPV